MEAYSSADSRVIAPDEENMLHLRHNKNQGLSLLFLVGVWLCTVGTVFAADSHRLLVLDIGRWPNGRPGSDHHRMRVLEIESGKVLAQADIRSGTSVEASIDGAAVAVICSESPRGVDKPRNVLEFYRSPDLKLIGHGFLSGSTLRLGYQLGAGRDISLSPTGQEVIIQGARSFPGPAHLGETLLTCVRRELDGEQVYKSCLKSVIVQRSYGIHFLRTADWPRIHMWNGNLGLLEVVDFDTGKILNRLFLGDRALEDRDPARLESANDNLIFQLRGRGFAISDGGRYAYYIPNRHLGPGDLKRIDLTGQAPTVIRRGDEPEKDLHPGAAVVSESAGALYVLQASPPVQNAPQRSRHAKVFNTSDLRLRRDIKLSLGGCDGLEVSRDGKLIYALDSERSQIVVIDSTTGREVKLLKSVGTYPYIMIALADTKEQS